MPEIASARWATELAQPSMVRWPPRVSWTPPQPLDFAKAVAIVGPRGPAWNVSCTPRPSSNGQLNTPGGNSGWALISATSFRTLAGSVTVTGAGGFFRSFIPGTALTTTARMPLGRYVDAGRTGCQPTCESTRT